MSLGTMLLYIAIAAIIFTGIVGFVWKKKESWLMSLLQNFCGILFLFSGWVKAVDPLGTAYKMEQYFGEFTNLFDDSLMSFISPLFPLLAEYAIGFSVFMIIFEIILGLMLILGIRPKLTAWLFFALVVFFTILTGFTYTTGFVPEGVNYFSFSSWGAFDENNMKVTDCGCFGDFVKLKPKTSFFKDIFLLFPSIYFVLMYKKMHVLFTKNIRSGILSISFIALFIYCLSNYQWDLPHTDFRPFKIGADIASQKQLEMDAAANVQIVSWKLRNIQDPKNIVELSNSVYMSEFSKYPKTEWEVVEQVKTEPEIEKTKISDFEISDLESFDVTDELLTEEGYSFWVVCHKLKGKTKLETRSFKDTLFTIDTIVSFNPETFEETFKIEKAIDTIVDKTEQAYVIDWNKKYIEKFQKRINPILENANQDGISNHVFIGKFGPDEIEKFKESIGLEASYYMADDILLKTIVRSNPGLVLVKEGKIIHKWHLSKLPSYENIKAKFIDN